MHRIGLLFIAGFCVLLRAEPSLAQGSPEREAGEEVTLTSRELIERLVRVEEGQKALAQRLAACRSNPIGTQYMCPLLPAAHNIWWHFDQISLLSDRLLEDVNTGLNKRIDDTNKRIDDLRADMNSRFSDVMTMLQIIISTLVALVLAIAGAGFIMWRKILAVDAAVQTKIGLDEAVREQVGRLERDVGFLQGRVRELGEALEKR